MRAPVLLATFVSIALVLTGYAASPLASFARHDQGAAMGGGCGPATSTCADCLCTQYWTVRSDYWRLKQNAPTPRDFPELTPRSDGSVWLHRSRTGDLGIAFSGGGTRSAAAVLGQLRGLQSMGWLGRVRYISAVSGGAWAAVPYVYANENADVLLGTHESPGALKYGNVLSAPNGLLAQAIVDSSLAAGGLREAAAVASDEFLPPNVVALGRQALDLIGRSRRDSERPDKTYARLIGRIFVDSLIDRQNRNASRRLFSWNDDSYTDAPPQIRPNLLLPPVDRPFLIVGGTLVSTHPDYAYPLLMPVEYTPLYIGVRQRFGPFGGTYVPPWAYDMSGMTASTQGFAHVKFDAKRSFTLGDVVASTGAAPQLTLMLGDGVPANVKQGLERAAERFPSFHHVAVRSGGPAGGDTAQLTPTTMPHGDGGFLDNLGLMPLLARQVRNILVFVNASNKDFRNSEEIRSLFLESGQRNGSGDKTHNVVFPRGDYEQLMKTLEEAQNDRGGRPLVACSSNRQVLANSHYNVQEYSGLNICWFYNALPAEWKRALPGDILSVVEGKDKARQARGFDTFPWFKTFAPNKPHVIKLTTAQVNLLSNLTAWTVTSSETRKLVRTTLSVDLGPTP